MNAVLAGLQRRWFLAALLGVLALGLSQPQSVDQLLSWLPQSALVVGVLFLMALPLPADHLWQNLRRPRAALLGIVMNMGLLPLLAWPMSLLLEGQLAAGLLLTVALPCTLTSAAVWTRQAGGNDIVALLVMLVTNLGCVVLTPLWILATTGARVETPFAEMVTKLTYLVALPIVLAQFVRLAPRVAKMAERNSKRISLAAQLGMLAMVLLGATGAGHQLALQTELDQRLAAGDWLAMLGSVVALHTLGLGIAHAISRLARLPRADRIAVGFSGSQKTLMVGFSLIDEVGRLAILPMVAYHAAQLIVDTLVVDYLRRRNV